MIFADVFGQTQVMQLARPRGGGGDGLPWLQKQEGDSYHRDTCYVEERKEAIRDLEDPLRLTSGSPESTLVWIRILPMRTSLHTALRAGSIVSPARRTDTPVICGDEEKPRGMSGGRPPENTTVTHPFPVVTAAFVLVTLRRLNDARLPETKEEENKIRSAKYCLLALNISGY